MENFGILAICPESMREYLKRVEPRMKLHFLHGPFGYVPTDEDLQDIKHVDICFGSNLVFETVMRNYPDLIWFHSLSAGNERAMGIMMKFKKLPMYTRNCSVYDVNVPQFLIAYILNHERNVIQIYENQKKKLWNKALPARPLHDVTVCILGLGMIGKPAAKLCNTLNMKVWAMTRRHVPLEQRESFVDEYRLQSDLEEMLENSDYIITILPSTPSTRGLLNGKILSKCKKKPVFINVGRGDIIDEDSIITALRNGWICKAVLDVFETEPLPSSSPLWDEPNVLVSPHTSCGLFPTADCQQMAQYFLDNYRRFLKGQDLVGKVTYENGY